MARKQSARRPRRRNPLVPAVRKLGQRIVPSVKRYKRRPKHPARDEAAEPKD